MFSYESLLASYENDLEQNKLFNFSLCWTNQNPTVRLTVWQRSYTWKTDESTRSVFTRLWKNHGYQNWTRNRAPPLAPANLPPHHHHQQLQQPPHPAAHPPTPESAARPITFVHSSPSSLPAAASATVGSANQPQLTTQFARWVAGCTQHKHSFFPFCLVEH